MRIQFVIMLSVSCLIPQTVFAQAELHEVGEVDGNPELSPSRTDHAAGSPEALLRLARRYAIGLGVERDMSMAATLRGQACELGSQRGCYELALMRLYGPRLHSQMLEAEQLLLEGCAAGFGPACLSLETARERIRVSAAVQGATDGSQPAPSDREGNTGLIVGLSILAVLALGAVTLGALSMVADCGSLLLGGWRWPSDAARACIR